MRKLQASDCALGTVGELLLAVEAHCRGGDEDGVAEPSGGQASGTGVIEVITIVSDKAIELINREPFAYIFLFFL